MNPFIIICKWIPIAAKKIVSHGPIHHHVRHAIGRHVHGATHHVAAHKVGAAGAVLVCTVSAAPWLMGSPPAGIGSPEIPSGYPAGGAGDFSAYGNANFASGYPYGLGGLNNFSPGAADSFIPTSGLPNIPVTEIPVSSQPVPEPASLFIYGAAVLTLFAVSMIRRKRHDRNV